MKEDKLMCVKDKSGIAYRCSRKTANAKMRMYGWREATKEEWKASGRLVLEEVK